MYVHVYASPLDMALPGLALPGAFKSLDSRLESVVQLCAAKGSPEAQVVGVVTVCEELKQLLKCAFIGVLYIRTSCTCVYICIYMYIQWNLALNNGHIGTDHFVHYREVVLFQR